MLKVLYQFQIILFDDRRVSVNNLPNAKNCYLSAQIHKVLNASGVIKNNNNNNNNNSVYDTGT